MPYRTIKMPDNNLYSVNLLVDTPAIKDEFGTHERIAEAIASAIKSEDGGITIGLEGGWGSGKSTVINLVKKKISINENKNATIVLFDAWAHQGDPLRRTFLETVISHLQNEKWVDTEK